MDDRLQETVDNFLAFTGAEKPKLDSVFIVVMGTTGSGKSSFIADATGKTDVKVGHDLASCTSSIEIFKAEIEGKDVYLIDTPGFDDTNRLDMEILKAIAHYFSVSYVNNIFLDGIIYMQRISDTRVGGTEKRNIEIMKGICGSDAYANVTIIANMWNANDKSEEFGRQQERERQLKQDYFADMINEGTSVLRHGKDRDLSSRMLSAKGILDRILPIWKSNGKITLQIQHEMANLNKTLDQTTAGRILIGHMSESDKSNERKIDKLQKLLDEVKSTNMNRNDQLASELQEQQSELRKYIEKSHKAQEDMRTSLLHIHREEKDRLLQKIESMERDWATVLVEKEREQQMKTEALLEIQRRHAQEERTRVTEAERFQQQLVVESRNNEEAARRRLAQFMEQQNQIERNRREEEARFQAEAERMRLEVMKLRKDNEARLESTRKVKRAWVGPLLQGVATGGLGLAGTLITAGVLCIIQ